MTGQNQRDKRNHPVRRHNQHLSAVAVRPNPGEQGNQDLRQETAQAGNGDHYTGGCGKRNMPDNGELDNGRPKKRNRLAGQKPGRFFLPPFITGLHLLL